MTMDWDVLELLRVLDDGAYGVVVEARHRVTNRCYAVKAGKHASADPRVIYQTMREVKVLRGLPPHPNIVHLEEAFQSEQGHIYLAFELAHGGLHKELAQLPGRMLPGPTLKAVAWQLLRALAHCHEHGIVHRDIKPANVLVTSSIAVAATAAPAPPSCPRVVGSRCGPGVAQSPQRGADAAPGSGDGALHLNASNSAPAASTAVVPGGRTEEVCRLLDSSCGGFSISPISTVDEGESPHDDLLESYGCGTADDLATSSSPQQPPKTPDTAATAAADAAGGAGSTRTAAATPFPLIKLCDFGFARSVRRDTDPWYGNHLTSYVVTRFYRAPEILTGDAYGTPIDVWSYGCTLAELATGRPLFPGRSCLDQLWRIIRCLGPLPPSQAQAMTRDLRLAPLAAAMSKPAAAADHDPSVMPTAARLQAAASELRSGPQGRHAQAQGDSDVDSSGGGSGVDSTGGGSSTTSPLAQALLGVEPRLLHLIAACLTLDPARRPTVHQLLQMPYFWEIDSLLCGTELEHLLQPQPAPTAAKARRPAAAAAGGDRVTRGGRVTVEGMAAAPVATVIGGDAAAPYFCNRRERRSATQSGHCQMAGASRASPAAAGAVYERSAGGGTGRNSNANAEAPSTAAAAVTEPGQIPPQQLPCTPFSNAAASAAASASATATAAVAAAASPTAASCTTQCSGRTWLTSEDGGASSYRAGRRPTSTKSGWGSGATGTGTSSFLGSSARPSLDSTIEASCNAAALTSRQHAGVAMPGPSRWAAAAAAVTGLYVHRTAAVAAASVPSAPASTAVATAASRGQEAPPRPLPAQHASYRKASAAPHGRGCGGQPQIPSSQPATAASAAANTAAAAADIASAPDGGVQDAAVATVATVGAKLPSGRSGRAFVPPATPVAATDADGHDGEELPQPPPSVLRGHNAECATVCRPHTATDAADARAGQPPPPTQTERHGLASRLAALCVPLRPRPPPQRHAKTGRTPPSATPAALAHASAAPQQAPQTPTAQLWRLASRLGRWRNFLCTASPDTDAE